MNLFYQSFNVWNTNMKFNTEFLTKMVTTQSCRVMLGIKISLRDKKMNDRIRLKSKVFDVKWNSTGEVHSTISDDRWNYNDKNHNMAFLMGIFAGLGVGR